MEDEFRNLRSQLDNYFARSTTAHDAMPQCRSFDARTRHRLHKTLDFVLDELERRQSMRRDIDPTEVTSPATTGTDVDLEGLSEQIEQEEEQ